MDEPLNGTSAKREACSWPVVAAGLAAVAGVGIGAFGLIHASSLQSDIKTLQDQVKALQNNVPASNATVSKLETEISTLQGSVQSVTTEVSTLQGSVQSVTTEVESVSKELSALESQTIANVSTLGVDVTSINQFLGVDAVVHSLQCYDTTDKVSYAEDGIAVARCPASCSAVSSQSHLWGTTNYTSTSSICLAAVHAGKLHLDAGGIVQIIHGQGLSHYTGSIQNGITSSDHDASTNSFSVGSTLRQELTDVTSSTQGELKIFFTDSCPPGWKEADATQGYILTGRPVGAAAGGTNGASPLDKDETGRVGNHAHGVNDPGHTHSIGVSLSASSGDSGHPTGYYPGPVAYQAQSSVDFTSITVQENNGEDLPLFYVLICQKM